MQVSVNSGGKTIVLIASNDVTYQQERNAQFWILKKNFRSVLKFQNLCTSIEISENKSSLSALCPNANLSIMVWWRAWFLMQNTIFDIKIYTGFIFACTEVSEKNSSYLLYVETLVYPEWSKKSRILNTKHHFLC